MGGGGGVTEGAVTFSNLKGIISLPLGTLENSLHGLILISQGDIDFVSM